MKQLIVILVAVAVLGGGLWWWQSQAAKQANTPRGTVPTDTKTNTTGSGNPGATEKSGTTTKTGKLTESQGVFYLQEAGQTPKEVDSYVVDLGEYVGQTVTVSGQYSGDTLFIGSVQ